MGFLTHTLRSNTVNTYKNSYMFMHPAASYYYKGVLANQLIYVLFTFISLIKILVVKIHKIYKVDADPSGRSV
jgi:hypothetical protein